MGGCASASVKDSDSKFLLKLKVLFSKEVDEAKLVISSPLKDKPSSINGSKEDAFFDSKAWLDSDCDDDFYSVKGDFTPSRGNTPVHHNFSIGTLQVNKSLFSDSTPEPSPNTKKKRLSELFQESLREDQGDNPEDGNNEIRTNVKVENKTTIPGLSPRASINGDYKAQKKNTIKSAQCCLPKMISSRSFNERRSKMSPVQSIG